MSIENTKRHEIEIDIGYGETIATTIEALQQALKEAENLGAIYTSFHIIRGSDGYVELNARIPKTEEEIAADQARELEWQKVLEKREREHYEKLKAKFECCRRNP
jgi:hypothetical protein